MSGRRDGRVVSVKNLPTISIRTNVAKSNISGNEESVIICSAYNSE